MFKMEVLNHCGYLSLVALDSQLWALDSLLCALGVFHWNLPRGLIVQCSNWVLSSGALRALLALLMRRLHGLHGRRAAGAPCVEVVLASWLLSGSSARWSLPEARAVLHYLGSGWRALGCPPIGGAHRSFRMILAADWRCLWPGLGSLLEWDMHILFRIGSCPSPLRFLLEPSFALLALKPGNVPSWVVI